MIEKFEPKEIFLTENAISKILSLREEESNKSLMLRVFVTGGGCSGFQYGFKFDDQKDDEDTLVDFDGADVVVDPLSMQYVFGSTIDYVQILREQNLLLIIQMLQLNAVAEHPSQFNFC